MEKNYEYFSGHKVGIKAWTKGVPFDPEAFAQAMNLSKMPFLFKHIAIMPDVHAGVGSTIGTVFTAHNAVIPSAVGVDIGCGMVAVKLEEPKSYFDQMETSPRVLIEEAVPHGRTDNGGPNDRGAWVSEIPVMVDEFDDLFKEYDELVRLAPFIETRRHPRYQLGTLGAGNHFIELSTDEDENVWLVIHSGSRGVGNRIGTVFAKKALEECRMWHIDLPDPALAYFPKGHPMFSLYIRCANWAQRYAKANRDIMMRLALDELGAHAMGTPIDCHHNFLDFENHFGRDVIVTRKGAVRAQVGDFGIIPGSMGERSFIVEGKGCAESFNSCSHGAGRIMSRTKARNEITVEEHIKATKGIDCRKDASVLDESPRAYKDIEAVMAAQTDLVEPIHILRQFVSVKG